MHTRSQREAARLLRSFAEVYFTNQPSGLKFRPRLFPLVVGPTGVGKTTLIASTAAVLEVPVLRVTYGDWLPRGVRNEAGEATVMAILRALDAAPRLILHIDELDKIREDYGTGWGRSVANDIWNVLDGVLPVRDFLTGAKRQVTEENQARLLRRIRDGLWIVGSGTWQGVFDAAERPSLGFAAAAAVAPQAEELAARIRAAEQIPAELLARFATELVFVEYPKTDEEVRELLDQSGLAALAGEVGEMIDLSPAHFCKVGFRCIESVAARLLVRRHLAQATPAGVSAPGPARPESPEPGATAIHRAEVGCASSPVGMPECGPAQGAVRMRLYRGRSVSGWGWAFCPDPAWVGVAQWCERFSLPLPKLRTDKTRTPGARAVEEGVWCPTLDAEGFYETLLHAAARRRHGRRYWDEAACRFASALVREPIDATLGVLIRAAFEKRPDEGPSVFDVSFPISTMRHLRNEVLRALLLAHRWLVHMAGRRSPDAAFVEEALRARLAQLEPWAVERILHPGDYAVIVEDLRPPEVLAESLANRVPWDRLRPAVSAACAEIWTAELGAPRGK